MNSKDEYKITDTGESFTIGKYRHRPVCTVWYSKGCMDRAVVICAALNDTEVAERKLNKKKQSS